MTNKLYAASLGPALTAAVALAALPVLAEERATNTGASEKRLIYVPHKSGYPLNFFYVPSERAEFASVEVDPHSRARRILPPPKSGHPFHIRD